MRHFAGVIACLICAALTHPAFAVLRTLDFEQYEVIGYSGPPQGFYYANIISGGARLSPKCHVHVVPPGFGNDSSWIAWDESGCGPGGTSNPDFLGDPNLSTVFLYLDFFGQPFNLESFDVIGNPGHHGVEGPSQ